MSSEYNHTSREYTTTTGTTTRSSDYSQFLPQPDLILDATTGQFLDPSQYTDTQGNLIPPQGFSFVTGMVLQNAMPFPEPYIPQVVDVPMVPYTNVPSSGTEHSMHGTKQEAIPRIYDYVKTEFERKNKFVKKRTVDAKGATFRLCCKSLESLLNLPRILLHVEEEMPITEVSLHIMKRRETYRKGITSYLKIEHKKDINRVLDIGELYNEKLTIVSKGDKDTRDPGLAIQILYKTDSNPDAIEVENTSIIDRNGEDALAATLTAMPMTKKKSSILTVMLPDTGHIMNLNIEGIEVEDTSDDGNLGTGLEMPHLDKHSSITLQRCVYQSVSSSKSGPKRADESDEEEEHERPATEPATKAEN